MSVSGHPFTNHNKSELELGTHSRRHARTQMQLRGDRERERESEQIRETLVVFCPLAGASSHENHSGLLLLIDAPSRSVASPTPNSYVRSGPARPGPRIAGSTDTRAPSLPLFPRLLTCAIYMH